MRRQRIKRNALNRGTAVYLGGSRVRLVWACDCTRVQTIKSPAGPLDAGAVARLVRNWRNNGVTLEQCRRHPDYYNKVSQLARLNAEHPQLTVEQ